MVIVVDAFFCTCRDWEEETGRGNWVGGMLERMKGEVCEIVMARLRMLSWCGV